MEPWNYALVKYEQAARVTLYPRKFQRPETLAFSTAQFFALVLQHSLTSESLRLLRENCRTAVGFELSHWRWSR